MGDLRKNPGKYESYNDFKSSWDPKVNVWEEIRKTTKTELKGDIQYLLRKNPFRKGIGHITAYIQ